MKHTPIITRTILDDAGAVASMSVPIAPLQPGLKGNPAMASAHHSALLRSASVTQWGHAEYSPECPERPVHAPLWMVDWACATSNQLAGESWRNEQNGEGGR